MNIWSLMTSMVISVLISCGIQAKITKNPWLVDIALLLLFVVCGCGKLFFCYHKLQKPKEFPNPFKLKSTQSISNRIDRFYVWYSGLISGRNSSRFRGRFPDKSFWGISAKRNPGKCGLVFFEYLKVVVF